MIARLLATLFAVPALVLAPAVAMAQATPAKPAAAKPAANVPRGPDGKPDLQGFWDFRTLTPLERPANLKDKAFLTEEEASALQKQTATRRAAAAAPSQTRQEPRAPGGGAAAVGGYNDFWLDFGSNVVGDRRTSLVVDPEDGRLPARKPGVAYQAGSLMADMPPQYPMRVLSTGAEAEGPESRGLAERCLVGFNSGPPMLPSGYNNHMQLVQTRDYVVILNEMNHDARIIPIGSKPKLPTNLRQWAGISYGYWEGDTLVVKTTNFTDKTPSFAPNVTMSIGTGSTLTLTERFKRMDAGTLHYQFTVDDPTTFTRPFTVLVPMQKSTEPVYEYACHEGNYGLMSIVRGAREQEKLGKK
jgi:hypothetical protein